MLKGYHLEGLVTFNKSVVSQYGAEPEFFKATMQLLPQLQRKGLISEFNNRGNFAFFVIHQELHDFIDSGGFTLRDTILQIELQKMDLEIQKLIKELGPDHLDKANKIAGIVGATISIIQAAVVHR